MVHVEFMLRLGEEGLPDVVVFQQLTADLDFTAIAFAEQQARLVTLPPQQHGTAVVLEQ
ncbi:hypothetical protein D3C80_1039570 [compost metagenome]